ncbi:hypothetical protein KIL84_009717 [Mauremys mutica]|uniref:Ig-like domain-containing protein n=1 Tax=Mauremys mutica TaxID=74926 RepID=A0A9D4B5B9_9SAUR|nr:hypothetical protein KIL84_009717 [Mauremys mutica]
MSPTGPEFTTDPPPQPALSVDPPSGAVSEGLPLLITCMAPKDASKWRFHFYKDGADVIPGDMGSEISITEPSIGSTNISVLSIPQAGPESTGEFTCGYEKNMSGRCCHGRDTAINTVYSMVTPPSAVAKQRGGKYISESVVYSKIPCSSQPLPPPRPTPR